MMHHHSSSSVRQYDNTFMTETRELFSPFVVDDDGIDKSCSTKESEVLAVQHDKCFSSNLSYLPIRMNLSFANTQMSVRQLIGMENNNNMTEQYLLVVCNFECREIRIDVTLRLPIVLIWLVMDHLVAKNETSNYVLDIYLNLFSEQDENCIQCFVVSLNKEEREPQFIHHESLTSVNFNLQHNTTNSFSMNIFMLNQHLPLRPLDSSIIEHEMMNLFLHGQSLSLASSN